MMMKLIIDNKNKIIIGLAFLVLVVMHLFMKPFTDDLIYLEATQEHGIWGLVVYFYGAWSGRIAANLLTAFFVNHFWLWRLLNPVVIMLCSYAVLRVTSLQIDMRKYIISLLLIFTINTQVLSQSIFWATGSFYYLWPLTAALFLIIPFFDMVFHGRDKISVFPIYIILTIIATMSNEQLSLLLCAFMVVLITTKLLNKKRVNIQFIILLAISLVCTYIMASAPGNQNRFDVSVAVYFPDFNLLSISERLSISLTWGYEMLFYILFFPIVLLMCVVLQKKERGKVDTILSYIAWSMVVISVFAYIYQGHIAVALYDFSSSLGWMGFLFWSTFFLLLLYFLFKENGYLYPLSLLTAVCSIAVMCFTPTMYASGPRTTMFAGVIICIMTLKLITEEEYRKLLIILLCAASVNLSNMVLRFLD
jgi:hypothetical protein